MAEPQQHRHNSTDDAKHPGSPQDIEIGQDAVDMARIEVVYKYKNSNLLSTF